MLLPGTWQLHAATDGPDALGYTLASKTTMSPVVLSGKGNALTGLAVLWKLGAKDDILGYVHFKLAVSVIGGFRRLLVNRRNNLPLNPLMDGAALGEFTKNWPSAKALQFTPTLGNYIITEPARGPVPIRYR